MTDLFESAERVNFFGDLRKSKIGKDCPCCGRFAKFYRHKITKAMIVTMAACLRRQIVTDDGWAHHNSFLAGEVRSFYNLKYFGLIEKKQPSESDVEYKRASGFWRVTPKGVQFLDGNLFLQKYAIVFDDKLYGFEGDEVFACHCYGEHFNYRELMNG